MKFIWIKISLTPTKKLKTVVPLNSNLVFASDSSRLCNFCIVEKGILRVLGVSKQAALNNAATTVESSVQKLHMCVDTASTFPSFSLFPLIPNL